jgi:hypothetical protein
MRKLLKIIRKHIRGMKMPKEGLGERFLKMIRDKLEQIAKNPEAFSQKTKNGYREAAVEIFPYIIV